MLPIGVYLYGFVPSGASLDLAAVEGVEGTSPVRTVEVGGSTAVVGEVALEALAEAMAAHGEGGPDPAWLIPRAFRHEAVLDAVLSRGRRSSRPGSAPSSRRSTRWRPSPASIARRSPASSRPSATGSSGLSAAITTRPARPTSSSSPTRSSPGGGPRSPSAPGSRYFLEKKLREEAKRASRREALAAADVVRRGIRSRSGEVRSLPLRAAEGPDREMVLHEAFLMSQGEALAAFPALAEEADRRVPGLLMLEPSGPWPPFHFCPDLGGPAS